MHGLHHLNTCTSHWICNSLQAIHTTQSEYGEAVTITWIHITHAKLHTWTPFVYTISMTLLLLCVVNARKTVTFNTWRWFYDLFFTNANSLWLYMNNNTSTLYTLFFLVKSVKMHSCLAHFFHWLPFIDTFFFSTSIFLCLSLNSNRSTASLTLFHSFSLYFTLFHSL